MGLYLIIWYFGNFLRGCVLEAITVVIVLVGFLIDGALDSYFLEIYFRLPVPLDFVNLMIG